MVAATESEEVVMRVTVRREAVTTVAATKELVRVA